MDDTPKVWIGCLASYNAGRLIGEWVEATDVDEMNEAQARVAKQAVTAAKAAGEYPLYFGDPEEFFIADYDNFGNLPSTLGEYPSYERVAKIGTLISDVGQVAVLAIDALEPDLDEVDEDWFHAHYRGEWDSEEDYAMHVCEEIGLPNVELAPQVYTGKFEEEPVNWIDLASSRIDWEGVARDMFRHGNYTSVRDGGTTHVFEDEV